ncbi:MAG: glycosyltransferase [Clostridiales Family XIII bacterium]|jgi:glycosyltransferase involved in cell wall biosynthesis|nr:glycosyltransferase [Clostridiales Family XIII bacterium]
MRYQVTIFTPTYNRAHTLEACYRSLQRQTIHDFEWLLIDDGSTDGTEALVNGWLREQNPFRIHFIKLERNEGLTRAYNRAFSLAEGKMFTACGSDDFMDDAACERILSWERSIAGLEGYIGVSGTCSNTKREPIGTTFEAGKEYVDTTYFGMRKNKIVGDKAEAYYTHLLRQYQYPVFEGEKFVPEGLLCNRIAADGYMIRWFNDIIRLGEYSEDGLSKNRVQNYLQNYKGLAFTVKEQLQYRNNQLDAVSKLRWVSLFAFISWHKKVPNQEAAKMIGFNRFLYSILKFLGVTYRRIRGY